MCADGVVVHAFSELHRHQPARIAPIQMQHAADMRRVHADQTPAVGARRKALRADPRVTRIDVDPSLDLVVVEAAAEFRAEVAATLARLGYPEKGSVEGLRSAAAVAKSFVSCAVGRLAD